MHFKNQPISQNIDRKELISLHDSLTIEHRELILTYMYTYISNNPGTKCEIDPSGQGSSYSVSALQSAYHAKYWSQGVDFDM